MRRLFAAGIVLLILLLPAGKASANGCSAAQSTPEPTIPQRVSESSTVLHGYVTGYTTYSPGTDIYTATVYVIEYLKGYGPAVVLIRGFHEKYDLVSCANWASIGPDYQFVFFAQGEPGAHQLSSVQTNRRAAVVSASPDVLSEVERAVGEPPRTPEPLGGYLVYELTVVPYGTQAGPTLEGEPVGGASPTPTAAAPTIEAGETPAPSASPLLPALAGLGLGLVLGAAGTALGLRRTPSQN